MFMLAWSCRDGKKSGRHGGRKGSPNGTKRSGGGLAYRRRGCGRCLLLPVLAASPHNNSTPARAQSQKHRARQGRSLRRNSTVPGSSQRSSVDVWSGADTTGAPARRCDSRPLPPCACPARVKVYATNTSRERERGREGAGRGRFSDNCCVRSYGSGDARSANAAPEGKNKTSTTKKTRRGLVRTRWFLGRNRTRHYHNNSNSLARKRRRKRPHRWRRRNQQQQQERLTSEGSAGGGGTGRAGLGSAASGSDSPCTSSLASRGRPSS